MKTSIYIENGLTQLVLTPENDWEQSIVLKIAKVTDPIEEVSTGIKAKITRGSFFQCRGGWQRYAFGAPHQDDDSLIVIVEQESELR